MKQRQDGNWIKGFLEQPVVYEPGTHFLYNSGATYMLSAIVQRLTGMTLLDYLQPRLLEPLGIENATWERSPQGINTGGWGMKIKTEDIARFGQMYLQKGVWNGKRVLSKAWIEQASSRQVENGDNPDSDWTQGYGYQFWRCRHGAYRGDGAFGQYCIVMPEQDAVLAMTGGVTDMQAVLNLVWGCLLPALGTASLPANPAADEALRHKLSSLALPPPQGRTSSPLSAGVSGRSYKADANPLNIAAVSFDFSGSRCDITMKFTNGEYRLTCGYGAWQESECWSFEVESPVIASGVWTADDTFSVTHRLYETPFYWTTIYRFTDDQLCMKTAPNVGFAGQTEPVTVHFA
jgi:hypothetical protein